MAVELIAMESNNNWTITRLPKEKHSIGRRWVYKVKYGPDGRIDRYKAHLVAKDYTQQEEVDFLNAFSPVAKLVHVKILLIVAAINKWHLVQLYVNNAFLNGDLFEEICKDLPLGYSNISVDVIKEGKPVCRLHKSIYGLWQAWRQ